MKPRLVSGVLAAALLSAAVPAFATRSAGAAHRVEYAGAGVVRGDLGPARGAPLAAARAALRDQAARLGVDAAAFRFETVRTSVVGTHVRGREFRGAVPVTGTAAAVHVVRGRVVQVEARGLAGVPGSPSASPVARYAAEAVARAATGTSTPLKVSAERVLAQRGRSLVDTWQVSVISLAPAFAGRVDVDAATGRVLGTVDDLKRVDGTAKVFDPNPIVSAQDASLRQPLETMQPVDADLVDAKLDAQRRVLPLKGLDSTALATGRLSGPWANVIAPGYFAPPGSPAFDVSRGDPRFEGLMAYAHMDSIQRYFQSLGFVGAKGVNDESQEVIATRVEGFDNSFYQPGNDLMLLGTGGVDDGEDAEVIVHEYGHAVHDAQVKGWGATAEGGAMGEGFGDFLAATYYARTVSKGFQDVCIMDWDATSYSDADPACLRRADVKKRYPDDLANQVHADGEMWSTFMWRLRQRLGSNAVTRSDNSLRLLLTSHEFLTPQAEFGDAVAALRLAARALRQPKWASLVDVEARRTGFPLNPS
ncbi:MAG TPA: M36 family metallopeptidase [Mycobacteriales bacterium]|nr:M36 family metallopeptidase [Mycobacteriales bacterium]